MLALALVAAVCSLLGQTAAEQSARASIRLVSTKPLVVRGEAFRPRERVKLIVLVGRKRTLRAADADAGGRFTARFPRVSLDRCGGGLTVRATGSRGSSAYYGLRQLDCAPPTRFDD